MTRTQPLLNLLLALLMAWPLAGCREQEQFDNTALGNFDALWTIIDEHYTFFADKDVDWDEVGARYRAKVNSSITSAELFELCGDMLKELKDGHTNLISASDVSRYWIWEHRPLNYDERLVDEHYLHFDYKRVSGIKYKILDNNFGYMHYGDFSTGIGKGNLDAVLSYLASADGLVIDVRGNGGGFLTNVETLVQRFITGETLVGYISHKTGAGHSDFSEPFPYTFSPLSGRMRWDKPVVVLANRSSFSATNNFVSIMSQLPNVTVVGDTTGGGCGMPFTSELPNGWTVRFSAAVITDANGQVTEHGVAPDVQADLAAHDVASGRDTILERAFAVLDEQAAKPRK